MLERGLLPDFSAEALAELAAMQGPATADADHIRDLRSLPWASIDNDDSRDLDQLTVAVAMPGNNVKIFVAVADVDSLVRNGSAIDAHARHNTTSVYTAAQVFPMLPEKLSTGLTSLNFNEDRLAIVAEIAIASDGSMQGSDICRAIVRNHAKLAYNSVAAWLDGNAHLPGPIAAVQGLDGNLRMQDSAAQSMKNFRHVHGALSFETVKAKTIFDGDEIRELETEKKNRAKDIIEDFMIAANGVVARYLSSKNAPSIRRVVRTPKRWERIVEIANDHGFALPAKPDAIALEKFLTMQKAADPVRFPDLSLVIIKLMGAGEYVAEFPGESAPGHFGLAVRDYTHSTAPNRRYPDLISQRLLKAVFEGKALPYSNDELDELAQHCTREEDVANKVERQVDKSAAALLLESRIGQKFDAIVTGAAAKGTWVRLLSMPVEGRLVRGFEGADVGHRMRVQLV
ncbi:MAG: RNB domain-containing ribonuclease, partial [Syntrophales bacterium LBB04]|nr:RNB domain-containing ribonuclease [Syntrophales bacterium LBB04]